MDRIPLPSLIPVLAAGLLLAGLATIPAAVAGPEVGAAGGEARAAPAPRMARVPQGARVELAPSALTPAELAALRPGIAGLKPKARGNSGD